MTSRTFTLCLVLLAVAFAASLLSGCASTPRPAPQWECLSEETSDGALWRVWRAPDGSVHRVLVSPLA